MARVRCITEMGMGVDVHGKDATKAARRAVSDAIRHSSLGFFRMLDKTAKDMFVDVTIGVPDPGAVDTDAVAKELPNGTVTVTAVKGGLEIPAEQGADSIIIANAPVVVSLEDDATLLRLLLGQVTYGALSVSAWTASSNAASSSASRSPLQKRWASLPSRASRRSEATTMLAARIPIRPAMAKNGASSISTNPGFSGPEIARRS